MIRLAPEEMITFYRKRIKEDESTSLWWLLQLRQADARPYVEKDLDDPSGMTRAYGLDYLFNLEGQAAIPRLRLHLEDPDEQVRQKAALLLIKAGERDGFRLLLESGRNLFHLNAIRNPAFYQRLSNTHLDKPFFGTEGQVLAHIGRKLGVEILEPPPGTPRYNRWNHVYQRIGSRLEPEPLTQELDHFPWAVILDDGRLRAISPEEAPAFWAAWQERKVEK
jgi:hypothetical protein